MQTDSRAYLNQYSVWGARTHDPANTQNIKHPNANFLYNNGAAGATVPVAPNSRYLSPNASTYLL